MRLLVFGHIGIVENALQIAVDAHCRGLQLVGRVLCELALQPRLVFLGVSQLPVEHDYGVADVAQFVVGTVAFHLIVERFALLGLDCKLAQIADMPADAACADIEHASQEQGQSYGEVNIGVVCP